VRHHPGDADPGPEHKVTTTRGRKAVAPTASVPQDVLDQTRADLEERVLTEFCAPLRAAGVAWQSRVLEGSAPIVLGDVATEVGAQLIVVGTRALHALGELLHGSTSHGLTLHTDVPIAMTPSPPGSTCRSTTSAAM
jgi:nucleotide-binding universal stress UspA family protein